MHLEHVNLINFKNISQAELQFSAGINCFVGENGSGKTNMLDAIYYLSFCKSYFNPVDSQNIMHEQDFFMIKGDYSLRNEKEVIYCGLKRNQKKQFQRNKKEYQKLAEHIGLLPLVVISPADEQLINDGSELRRKYIDSVISQYDQNYLDKIIRYNRVLLQRNSLLKQLREGNGHLDALDIWDEQLVDLGATIYAHRTAFIEELSPVYHHYQSYMVAGNEKVELAYKSDFQLGELPEQLLDNRRKDVILGYTSKGIHKDDLELLLDGYPIKKTGSQGQKKTFLIALKLAQYDFLVKHNGLRPILLLDDIFDKLDEKRGGRLVELVAEDHFQQIFITDTRQEHLNGLLAQVNKPSKIFNVKDGVYSELKQTGYAKE